MADIKAKFVIGAEIRSKNNDPYSYRDPPDGRNPIIIEDIVYKENTKTSFYVINNARYPIRYVEKRYKSTLSNTLKLL